MKNTEHKRRNFLPYALLAIIALAVAPLACKKPSLESKLGTGSVQTLPNHGFAYIINDIHADFKAYQDFVAQTNIYQRIQNGEDVYLVINGDVVDKKDLSRPGSGDSLILEDVIARKKDLEKQGKGNRIQYNRGNHEDVVHMLEQEFLKSGLTKEEFVNKLYNDRQNGQFFRQFNSIERLTPSQDSFISHTSLVIKCDDGVYIMHGSPSDNPDSLLWGRGGNADGFLKIYGGNLIVNGHSTPNRTNELGGYYDLVRQIGVVGNHRVIAAPFEGSNTGKGTFVVLDLSKVYTGQKDLKYGKEIQPIK